MVPLHFVLSFHHSSSETVFQSRFRFLMVFFTESIQRILGIPCPLFPDIRPSIACLGSLTSFIRLTCPNHLNLFCSSLSFSFCTPNSFRISSFLTLSLLVFCTILLRNFISRKDHNMKIKFEYNRTNWGKYSFTGRGVRDWNNLPTEMFDKFPTSLKLFRRRLGK